MQLLLVEWVREFGRHRISLIFPSSCSWPSAIYPSQKRILYNPRLLDISSPSVFLCYFLWICETTLFSYLSQVKNIEDIHEIKICSLKILTNSGRLFTFNFFFVTTFFSWLFIVTSMNCWNRSGSEYWLWSYLDWLILIEIAQLVFAVELTSIVDWLVFRNITVVS
jgi:hypothetical protein